MILRIIDFLFFKEHRIYRRYNTWWSPGFLRLQQWFVFCLLFR